MGTYFRKGAVLEKMAAPLTAHLAGASSGADDLTEEQIQALTPSDFAVVGMDVREAENIGYSNYSYWRSTIRMFWKNGMARFLTISLLLLLLFTVVQPYIPGQRSSVAIFNYEDGQVMRNLPPDRTFWFGTDAVGHDLWSRIWAGTRTSLFLAFVVAMSNCLIGITIGIIWGYVRRAEAILTEVYNIMDNIPRTIILILISYIMRPGMSTMILSMCIVGWLGMARFIRNQIVIIRDRDYNLASRCLGTGAVRIMIKNLLPYMVSVIMLQTALAIPYVISDEVFLTYCGLGMPKAVASLGNLVEDGRQVMMSPSLRYQLLFPACVVTFITVAFYLIGNAFSDAADPKNHV